MAKINGRKLGIGVVMGFTFVLISGGLFGLVKSSLADKETVQMTAQAPMAGDNQAALADDSCEFSEWVGKDAADAKVAAEATSRPVRILAPDTAATMDFSPARINIETDDNGVVTNVRCG